MKVYVPEGEFVTSWSLYPVMRVPRAIAVASAPPATGDTGNGNQDAGPMKVSGAALIGSAEKMPDHTPEE